MNKTFYICILIVSGLSLLFLGEALRSMKQSQIILPPEARKTTNLVSQARKNFSSSSPAALSLLDRDIAYAIKHDVFHPARGEYMPEKSADATTVVRKNFSHENFILRGVFKMGNKNGALIEITGRNTSSITERKSMPNNLFMEGAEISNGYILKEIGDNRVIIVRGSESTFIEMEKLPSSEKRSKNLKAENQTRKK